VKKVEYLSTVGVKNAITIVVGVRSMTLSNLELSLKLELLRLKSICRVAAEELDSLHEVIEENKITVQKCNKLIAALKENVFVDYIKLYPDLEEKQNNLLKSHKES